MARLEKRSPSSGARGARRPIDNHDYVIGHDESLSRELVEFFQSSDFAGVILTSPGVGGSFSLSQIRLATTDAPDVLVSSLERRTERFWRARPDDFRRGQKGKGTYASLNCFDMHNTLVAKGPDFRTGFIDDLPSGKAHLGPTIPPILGITPLQPMDGRVLAEALVELASEHQRPPRKPSKPPTRARCISGASI